MRRDLLLCPSESFHRFVSRTAPKLVFRNFGRSMELESRRLDFGISPDQILDLEASFSIFTMVNG